jgi:hypothetical protein
MCCETYLALLENNAISPVLAYDIGHLGAIDTVNPWQSSAPVQAHRCAGLGFVHHATTGKDVGVRREHVGEGRPSPLHSGPIAHYDGERWCKEEGSDCEH